MDQPNQPQERPISPLDRLQPREAEFVEKVVTEGKPKVIAAQEAFGIENYNTASTKAKRLSQNGLIVEAMAEKKNVLKEALIAQGITPKKIAQKVDLLLEATDKDGNDDHTAIDKGLKHATTIFGVVDPQEARQDAPRTTYNFIFSAPVQEEVRRAEAAIKSMLVKKPNVQTDQESVDTEQAP